MKPLAKLATLLAITGMAGFSPGLALASSNQGHCQGNMSTMMQQHQRMGMGGPGEQHGMQAMMGKGMGGPKAEPNGQQNRAEWLRNRQQHLQKMVARLKDMESNLNQKLAAMNRATGRQKLSEMSVVLNELVHQRNEVFNHVLRMQEHRLARLEHFHQRFGQNAMAGIGQQHAQSHQNHASGSSFGYHNQKELSQK